MSLDEDEFGGASHLANVLHDAEETGRVDAAAAIRAMSPPSEIVWSRGNGWELGLGDCLAGLAGLSDKSCAATIMDPPYEAEAHARGRRVKVTGWQDLRRRGLPEVGEDDIEFPAITEEQRAEVASQASRISTCLAITFCQIEAVSAWRSAYERAGMIYRRTIPWIKPDAMPSLHGRWPGQAFEAIVLAMHRGQTAPVGGGALWYKHPRERGEARAHPTAKPIALMRQIVEDFTRPGDRVLDAFAGSGTTGVACKMLGRSFVGFELDPAFHAIAASRLRGEGGRVNRSQFNLDLTMDSE